MKKIVKTIVLFLFVFFINVSAQVPGYMGKRLSIGYGFYANPALASYLSKYSDKMINKTHDFFAEYAVGKKASLGISAQLYRYTYKNTEDVDVIGNGGYYSYTTSQSPSGPEGSYEIKGRNFRFYAKFFRRNYVAPWGKYFFVGAMLNKYITTYNPDEMYVTVSNYINNETISTTFHDFGPTTNSFNTGDIFFGNGNNRILADKIVLDYGYSIGIISTMRMFSRVNDYYDAYREYEYIRSTALRRVAGVNRFNLFIKVGYLF